jgi:hypothetical protein
MRLVSKKTLSALRRINRVHRTVPDLGRAPPICAPVFLGSQLHPIVLDNVCDDTTSTNVIDDSTSLLNSLRDLSISDHGTNASLPTHHEPKSSSEPTPTTENSYVLVPMAQFTAENLSASARVCLHNLRQVALYHGFDLEEVNNDEDHRYAFAVALEREITEAHERINTRMNTVNTQRTAVVV